MPFLTIKENGQSLVKSAFKVSFGGKNQESVTLPLDDTYLA